MRNRPGVVLAGSVALAAVLLAGCSPSDDPSPSPTPTYQCTAPGACTPEQSAKEAKARKDHADAEKALKDGVAESYRILGEGGADKATPELKRTTAGDELTSDMDAFKEFKKLGRVGHGTATVVTVRFNTPYPGDTQTLVVCQDGTKYHTTDREGKNPTRPGKYQSYHETMTLIDGQWKRTDSTNLLEVETCKGT